MTGKIDRAIPAASRRASDELHRTILQAALDGYWLADADGRLLEVNDAYCQMSGYAEDELLAMSVSDLDAGETASGAAAHCRTAVVRGEDRFESRHRRKDGSVFDVAVSVRYQPADGGRFVVFLQDLTDRKRLETALRTSQDLFSLFMRHSPICVYLKDVSPTESRVLQASDNFREMLGLSGTDLLGKTMAELFPPEFAARITADDWNVVTHGQVLRRDEDFNGRNYTSIKFPIVREGKTLLAGYTIDITDRKRAEQALQESETRSRRMIDTAAEGICANDGNWVLTFVNPTMAGMLGYEVSAMIGRKVQEFFFPEDQDACNHEMAERAKGRSGRYERRFRKKDGGVLWALVSATAIMTPEGGFDGSFAMVTDISERKQLEAALEKRLVALTRPLDEPEGITFDELFEPAAIQRLQDEFAAATGVASIITRPDGTPITRPSHFCRLCKDLIRCTETGRRNCYLSDAQIGRQHPGGPIVQPCLSGGLWDAGASITVGNRHLANWLIGQVRDETQNEGSMRAYARVIGADEEAVATAFREVPAMSSAQFKQIA